MDGRHSRKKDPEKESHKCMSVQGLLTPAQEAQGSRESHYGNKDLLAATKWHSDTSLR